MPQIDEAQYREGKGPCLDAWRQRAVVRLDLVEEHASAYPAFASACCDHGVASTLSLPMMSGDIAVGAMNLYAKDPEAFRSDDEAVGLDLATAAGAVLANVAAYWTAFDLSQQLTEAMRTRSVIEQAKGMLMARTPSLTADGAFDMLKSASQRENVKLSVPSTWGDEVVATLNLYSRIGPFDQSAVSVAAVLGAQVAIAVSRSPEYVAARAVVEQSQREVEDASDINVATGLLMVSQACTADQAAGLLQEAASHDEQTILEIAHRIIEQHHSSR